MMARIDALALRLVVAAPCVYALLLGMLLAHLFWGAK